MANNQVRNKILKTFEGIEAKPGHALDYALLLHRLIINLNPRENDNLFPEINLMAEEGLINIDGDIDDKDFRLVLTDLGYDKLYR